MGGEGSATSAGVVESLLDAKGDSARTVGKEGPVLWCVVEVWDCAWSCFRTAGSDSDPGPGSTTLPSSDPLVGAPLFVLDVLDLLPQRSFPCRVR